MIVPKIHFTLSLTFSEISTFVIKKKIVRQFKGEVCTFTLNGHLRIITKSRSTVETLYKSLQMPKMH